MSGLQNDSGSQRANKYDLRTDQADSGDEPEMSEDGKSSGSLATAPGLEVQIVQKSNSFRGTKSENDEEMYRWHTVAKGETLLQVAYQYEMSLS